MSWSRRQATISSKKPTSASSRRRRRSAASGSWSVGCGPSCGIYTWTAWPAATSTGS